MGAPRRVRHLPAPAPARLLRPRSPHLPRHASGPYGDHHRHGDHPRPPPQAPPRPRRRRRPHPRPSLPLPGVATGGLLTGGASAPSNLSKISRTLRSVPFASADSNLGEVLSQPRPKKAARPATITAPRSGSPSGWRRSVSSALVRE